MSDAEAIKNAESSSDIIKGTKEKEKKELRSEHPNTNLAFSTQNTSSIQKPPPIIRDNPETTSNGKDGNYKSDKFIATLICYIFDLIKRYILQEASSTVVRKMMDEYDIKPNLTETYAISIKKKRKSYGTIGYARQVNFREDLVKLLTKSFSEDITKWKELQKSDIAKIDVHIEMLRAPPRKLNSLSEFQPSNKRGIIATYTHEGKPITTMILPSQMGNLDYNLDSVKTHIAYTINTVLKQNHPIEYYENLLTVEEIITTIYSVNHTEYMMIKNEVVECYNLLKAYRIDIDWDVFDE